MHVARGDRWLDGSAVAEAVEFQKPAAVHAIRLVEIEKAA
ncbi:MAG: hypothetical protein OJF58_003928 [Enhydrobacter sp.]|jgi:hypothetical protein|nr:MAG: hypothetical protein OJF58_003928 [Enhydrobacter sp.]